MAHNNLLLADGNMYVLNALNSLIDSTQDFTDSLFINNEQRERIIRLQNEIREKTLLYLKEEIQTKQNNEKNKLESANNAIDDEECNSESNKNMNRFFKATPILNDCEVLKKLLQTQTMQLTNCMFRENQDATLLNCIKSYAMSNHYDLLIDSLDKFKEYSDHVLEVNI